ILSEVVGLASWTRRQVVVADASGLIHAWATVHDRAAGRTAVELTVEAPSVVDRAGDAPLSPTALDEVPDEVLDEVAAALLAWLEAVAQAYGGERAVLQTQLDALLDLTDDRQRRWFRAAGFHCRRTWLNMSRPVDAQAVMPGPRAGVTVRRVGVHDLGDGTTVPVAEDLQAVHRVLEESFEDHFNSYRESFPEFAARLREDPGHRWDHWWLALVEVDGETVVGGALVGSVLAPDDHGVEGSYIDYIGVHRRARGMGVAKALLHTVINDAAQRGRDRVDLEVDADSPTGADGLYRSMGWELHHTTESWQKDLTITS
ncbi:MAG: GNAT family N-acetyltransferase, partial [Lapillicoccus sp.]